MPRQTLTVTIVTFITVLGWIGFEIYHSAVTTTIDPEYKNIQALDNNFDSNTLNDIETRQVYELYKPFSLVEVE